MRGTPRMDEAIEFVKKQLKEDGVSLLQDHPYYVIDVLGNEGKRLERSYYAALAMLQLVVEHAQPVASPLGPPMTEHKDCFSREIEAARFFLQQAEVYSK